MIRFLFLFLFVFILIPFTSNAISLNELRNNPIKYKLVYSDSLGDQYVNNDSINVIRYAPPYYIIKSTAYLVSYQYNVISELDNTYFYDYSNNVSVLLNKTHSEAEFGNQVTKYAGVKYQTNILTIYNYNGELYEGPVTTNKGPKIPKILSPAYESAMYSFYKSYNMYFNLPSKMQKF